MGLTKGHTNNPAGRPKGTPNKAGAELRERVTAFVADRWGQFESDFDQLEPKERMQFIEKLMAYTMPKLQAVAVDYIGGNEDQAVTIFRLPDNGRTPDFRSMTDEELNLFIGDRSFDPSKMTDEELRAAIVAEGDEDED